MISYSRFVFFVRQCPMWDGAQLGGVPRPLDGTARSNKKRREREYTKAHWTKTYQKRDRFRNGVKTKEEKNSFFYHFLCIKWTSFSFNPWPYSYLKISPSSKMFIFLLQIFSSFSFFLARGRVWPGLPVIYLFLMWRSKDVSSLNNAFDSECDSRVHCPLNKTNSDNYEIKMWRWYLFNRPRYVAGSGNKTKSVCRSRGYFGSGKENIGVSFCFKLPDSGLNLWWNSLSETNDKWNWRQLSLTSHQLRKV